MPSEIIVAHEKHGTVLYANAIACLRRRVNEGYWYTDSDAAEACAIVHEYDSSHPATAEHKAWAFLLKRADHEYEGVSAEAVID